MGNKSSKPIVCDCEFRLEKFAYCKSDHKKYLNSKEYIKDKITFLNRKYQHEQNMTKYIVVLKNESKPHLESIKKELESKGGKVIGTFDGVVLLGYAVELPDNLLSTFEALPHIDYIEKDGTVDIVI